MTAMFIYMYIKILFGHFNFDISKPVTSEFFITRMYCIPVLSIHVLKGNTILLRTVHFLVSFPETRGWCISDVIFR